jgi:cytochrome b561
MQWTNSDAGYGRVALLFHWIMALLMVAAFLLGQQLEGMARGPEKLSVLSWHLLAGGAVLALVMPRLIWRRHDPAPPPPAGLPRWESLAASATHALFYLLMLALPLTGLATVLSFGKPLPLFGTFELPVVPLLQGWHETLETLHTVLPKVLVPAVVLHVAATVWHRAVRRDPVPGRMIPFLRQT